MTMTAFVSVSRIACVLAALFVAGCATTPRQEPVPSGDIIDAPARFFVEAGEGTTTPLTGQNCRNRMVDPRDGTRLILVSSAVGQGEYRVPTGRYGVGRDQLLRIDCDTGVALEIVDR